MDENRNTMRIKEKHENHKLQTHFSMLDQTGIYNRLWCVYEAFLGFEKGKTILTARRHLFIIQSLMGPYFATIMLSFQYRPMAGK